MSGGDVLFLLGIVLILGLAVGGMLVFALADAPIATSTSTHTHRHVPWPDLDDDARPSAAAAGEERETR